MLHVSNPDGQYSRLTMTHIFRNT